MTGSFPERPIRAACAVLHTDGEGNTIPCPGHPHAEPPRRFAGFGEEDCPHCDEPQPPQQMDAHVARAHADIPPCTAYIDPDHGGHYACAFRAEHAKGKYGKWHASKEGEDGISGSRYVWNDTAKGATPHQPPEPSDSLDKFKAMGALSHTVIAMGGDGPEADADERDTADESHPQPPSDEELDSVLPVRPDPRQPAYDAVFTYIRRLGDYLPPDPVHRNAIIWRAVQAALEATPVGRCISSHCVEGGHILPVESETP